MPWPTPQDYNEALQNPGLNFEDTDLRAGSPEVTSLGLPRAITGGFASVYSVRCGSRRWAVRCFLRDFSDHQERYAEIGRHLGAVHLPYTVSFQFLEKGIRVRGHWYPVLKMEWIEGYTFQQIVEANTQNPTALADLAQSWVKMLGALRKHGVAHGDLQHGNVLITGGDFRLIDYDGMFVPSFAGRMSHEVGHRNYQHPARTENDFGPHLDNFSGWAIYLTLIALSTDPSLWNRFGGAEEHLLFRKEDFDQPRYSRLFRNLQHLKDDRLQKYLPLFRSYLGMRLSSIASPADVIGVLPNRRNTQHVPLPGWSGDGQLNLFSAKTRPGPAASMSESPASVAVDDARPPGLGTLEIPNAASEPGSVIETAPVEPFRFTGSVASERLFMGSYAVFIAVLIAFVTRGNLPRLDAAFLVITGLGCLAACTACSYVALEEVRKKAALWLCLELRRNRYALAQHGVAHMNDWVPRIELKQSQKVRYLAARDIDYARLEKDRIVEVKRTLVSWVGELNLRRTELDRDEAEEAAQLLSKLQAEHDLLLSEGAFFSNARTDALRQRDLKKVLKWRKHIDEVSQSGAPTALSAADRSRIRKKYDLERQAVRRSETFARAAARNKILKIQRSRKRRHQQLDVKRSAVQRRFERRKQHLQRTVDRGTSWLDRERLELSRKVCEVSRYRHIRFSRYVLRVIGLSQKN